MTQPFQGSMVRSRRDLASVGSAWVRGLLALAVVFASAAVSLSAADLPETMPLDQVKPGMVGEAHTIFAGDQIEKFDLVVLGILPNLIGPRQSIILVQLK